MSFVRQVGQGPGLEDVYRRLLAPSFSPAELEPLDDLATGVASGDVEVLAHDEDGAPAAVAVAQRGAATPVTLLAYLAVDSSLRSRGLGSDLLEAALDRWARPGGVVLAEVEHPLAPRVDDAWGDPRRRLAFYARHGARVLDLPYFQPPVRPGAGRVYGMLLVVLRADPALTATGRLASSPVAAFLETYLAGTDGLPRDAATRALLERAATPAGIALLDPTGDPAALPRSAPVR